MLRILNTFFVISFGQFNIVVMKKEVQEFLIFFTSYYSYFEKVKYL